MFAVATVPQPYHSIARLPNYTARVTRKEQANLFARLINKLFSYGQIAFYFAETKVFRLENFLTILKTKHMKDG